MSLPKSIQVKESLKRLKHLQKTSKPLFIPRLRMLQVIKESGNKNKIKGSGKSKNYMWLYKTGDIRKPIILYDFRMSRSGMNPKKFLENFAGVLQTDGYAAETEGFGACFETDNFRQGTSAFLQKRKPKF